MKKLCLFICGLTATMTCYAASNLLLVGTTGDYPPLTYLTESGYQGNDIRLIERFATENGLRVMFKASTWPHLSQDLAAGKFDVAVGGISLNPERSKLFLLSEPIEYTAKAVLIRCNDRSRFQTWAEIDSESTIIIENRGGTNQAFAVDKVKNAQLIVVSKNFAALAAITESNPQLLHADVMFTDDVEISYRHQLNPLLCQANLNEKFPLTPKVFMFNKDANGEKLQRLFNQWLKNNHESAIQ